MNTKMLIFAVVFTLCACTAWDAVGDGVKTSAADVQQGLSKCCVTTNAIEECLSYSKARSDKALDSLRNLSKLHPGRRIIEEVIEEVVSGSKSSWYIILVSILVSILLPCIVVEKIREHADCKQSERLLKWRRGSKPKVLTSCESTCVGIVSKTSEEETDTKKTMG